MRPILASLAALFAICLTAATARPTLADQLAELRSTFTVDGKPVPPEIFADFGDADLADSDPVVVTIDARAATGSNRYADPIRTYGRWIIQTKANDKTMNGAEETAYEFIGTTRDNLLVVVASFNGGGSGTFYTLHVLDAALARAFDADGKRYDRLNLTLLRSAPLGDRWEGTVAISGNTIRITSPESGPARGIAPAAIEARRP